MSKRNHASAEQNGTNVKKTKHWSLGLLESMKDPKSIVISTKNIVVIRDKYPKAKIHYLVLPHEEISSIYKLNNTHVGLLEEFGEVFKRLQKEEDSNIKAGFHAVPSMFRLHMHVISQDMVSPCLKTKTHWNSFTTKFFLPYEGKQQVYMPLKPTTTATTTLPFHGVIVIVVEDSNQAQLIDDACYVLSQLKENGSIRKISSELHKSLMATELQCNQCSQKPKNMPQLKEHLLSHIK